MAKIVPMETRQSMLEEPSNGSKHTMYFPCVIKQNMVDKANQINIITQCVAVHILSYLGPQWWLFHLPLRPAHRRWRRTWSCWWPGHWTGYPTSSPDPPSHWCFQQCHTFHIVNRSIVRQFRWNKTLHVQFLFQYEREEKNTSSSALIVLELTSDLGKLCTQRLPLTFCAWFKQCADPHGYFTVKLNYDWCCMN